MNRIRLIDTIRGITIISMILYHACWDAVYFGLGIPAGFLESAGAYIWQQSICWSFIFISGFCFCYGKRPVKRGLAALGGGILITLVTMVVVPDAIDVFGVLYLIGSSILIMTVIDRIAGKKKKLYPAGLVVSIIFFAVLRNLNRGTFGFEGLSFGQVPVFLYKGYFMTYLGFKDPAFYSSDYFSLIPWFFLFSTGYFSNKLLDGREKTLKFFGLGLKIFEFPGRHSLIIYMLHQIVLFVIFYLIASFF